MPASTDIDRAVTPSSLRPVILFPAAFVWYLNVGGIVHAAREARAAKARQAAARTIAQ